MNQPRVFFLGCGALAREVSASLQRNQGLDIEGDYLPASLHNRPERISGELRRRLALHASKYDRILLGYGDCGTGGEIDAVCDEYQIERLPDRIATSSTYLRAVSRSSLQRTPRLFT